jgi:hypothetical protein
MVHTDARFGSRLLRTFPAVQAELYRVIAKHNFFDLFARRFESLL